jgi:histidinol dehydrogenase
MRVIEAKEFDAYWAGRKSVQYDKAVTGAVEDIISAVAREGDAALHRFAAKFDRSDPPCFEVDAALLDASLELTRSNKPELVKALEFAANNIKNFALEQKKGCTDFEVQIAPGLFAGQRIVPVQRAAVYIPGGAHPYVSTALMDLIPALASGCPEVILATPPQEDGLPNRDILAAAAIGRAAVLQRGASAEAGSTAKLRVFALGGAQAIAALALGTQSVPRADFIAGPGNKYVAAAKRLLYGRTGIDFVAGPTDVLIIADSKADPVLVAADMLAQAEHDKDARARLLAPDRDFADRVVREVEKQLAALPTKETAKASLDAGGLVVLYQSPEEAACIADKVAPEHLSLHLSEGPGRDGLVPLLHNYGSLFIGGGAAEVLGDYSAGVNHTLPTSTSARFTGGLSVRSFLKVTTTLRCTSGTGVSRAYHAAHEIAVSEALAGHAASARLRTATP